MENILKKKYMRFLDRTLSIALSWPVNKAERKMPLYKRVYKHWVVIQAFMIVFGQATYVAFSKDLGFDIIGQIWLGIFSASVYAGRLIVSHTKKYEILLMYYLNHFHLEHCRNKDQYYFKVYNKFEKLSNYFSAFMAMTLITGVFFLNMGPILSNISAGWYFNSSPPNTTFDHAIFCYPTFVHAERFPIITSIYNIYLITIGFSVINGTDIIIVLMVFQLIGRIMITSEMIKNVKIPSKDPGQVDDEIFTCKTVHEQLVAIIKDHKEVVGFADMISELFGPLIAHVYLFDLVGGCVLLLELTSSNLTFVVRFGPISLSIIGQLIQISVIFELIGHMSEKLIDDVYNMPWSDMSIPDQRIVRILLMRVQQPIQVTAIGMVPVGVKTMASLLKASVSYYLFLNSKKK